MEFEALDLTDQAPPEICPECAKLAVAHLPTVTSIAYCTHKLCGAYRVLDRPWKIIRGVEASVFSDVVIHGLTAGELRVGMARAVRGEMVRILEAQAKNATMN